MDDLEPMAFFTDADFAAVVLQLDTEEALSRNNARYFKGLIEVLDARGVQSEWDRQRRGELLEAAKGAEARAQERAVERERWERLREQAQ